MTPRLHNKVAVVTGAASGFGASIAERFAQEGARVVVVDLNLEKGQEVASRIGGVACRCDVSSSADIEQLLQFTLAQFGRLDIVVNNAGTTHPNKPAGEVTEAEFDRLYQVNVKSLFHMNRHVTPLFRQQCGGVFVNVASTTGVRPGPGLCWYSASKGAVITASKGLALELAKDQIRVCVINPMIGETPLMEQFMGMPDTPENRQKFLARIPLGRFTQPLDVAHAAVYLASDEAAFLTGVCLDVDGGRNI
ncbi:glucose 1-dehydrogenase [Limnohabitans sp. 2KL-27]|uniref:glucose 1-dehydrogenase n=1 Tax=Limnohabitans sp. 2KL-27 TaxID=1100705 RepID=UPI000B22AAAE|nr:glucose 1-dehydrogenase [Limnohabitans sp. 2KL-27]